MDSSELTPRAGGNTLPRRDRAETRPCESLLCHLSHALPALIAYQPVIALQHNEVISGGSALAVHITPFLGPNVAPSVSIAVAVNHDTGNGFGDGDVDTCVGIVRQAELDQSWPEGDLWSD